MALFGGKAKKEEIENNIRQNLTRGEVIRYLANWMRFDEKKDGDNDENNAWVYSQDGYYDDCKRTVIVTADSVYIFKCSSGRVNEISNSLRKAKNASNASVLFSAFSDRAMSRSLEYADEKRKIAVDGVDELGSVEAFIFNCTWCGYRPLRGFEDESTGIQIPLSRVVSIWTEVVRDLIKHMYKDFEFGGIDTETELFNSWACNFGYKVPKNDWKSWF